MSRSIVETIEDVIGEDRALELSFDIRFRQLSAEDWNAHLFLRKFDENSDEAANELVSSAQLVRVSLDDGR